MTAVSCITPAEEKRGQKNLLAMELVEDDVRLPVPNYLVDTKIYSRVARNAFVQAQPSEIHFGGFEVGRRSDGAAPCFRRTVRLVNVASEVTRFHIVPPEDTAHFTLKYTKPARLVPGFAVECVLEFRPDECRYYFDALRIHTMDEENNLVVPIHAYPVLGAELPFPKFLKFGLVPVGFSKKKVLPVRCNAPVDFEFKIDITQDHPAISIEPLEGVIPANGSTDVEVTFAPVDFVTAHLSLEFRISQFNSEPLICHISGGSEPGMERNRVVNEWAAGRGITSLSEDVSALDPRVQSPLDRARTRKVQRLKSTRGSEKEQKAEVEEEEKRLASAEQIDRTPGAVVERSGLRIPTQLDTPFAVGQVLSQEPGKLKIRDLREVMNKGENRVDATRQMKEAIFEQEVRQNVYEERQNQLRWQIRVGDEPITNEKRLEVVNHRTLAWTYYQQHRRGVPVPEEELQRAESTITLRRTFRDSALTASETLAKFDRFQNDDWASRQDCIERFRQAARKIIVRRRADHKISSLRELVTNWRRGKFAFATNEDNRQKEEAEDEEEDMLEHVTDIPNIAVHRVTSQRFASWGETPSLAAAVNTAGKGPKLFSVAPTDIILRPHYDFFGLKVPQVFRLNNYEPLDVHACAGGHVPVRAIRQFKVGALDEIISLPTPAPLIVEDLEQSVAEEEEEAKPPLLGPEEEEAEALRRALLKPPASLFRPLQYPPLHIFNPAPGLQVFEQPQPYGETDPDFRLCPLPRYVARSPAEHGPFMTTQKRYLDREDVIRGMAHWKTFPSLGLTSLGNTPTLTSVWVPRWSEAFASELLPSGAPPLVDGLPAEDEENLLELDDDGEEKQVVALTPEMVMAEFRLGGCDAIPEEGGPGEAPTEPEINEDFPHGSKMPPSNIPVSAKGPVPRWTREKELEFFLNKKSNRLGSRVATRVRQMDQLVRHTRQLPLN